MNAAQFWTCLFLLLVFSEQSCCSSCEWIKQQYSLKNGECLRLLKLMGEAHSSANHPFSIPFPNKLYSELEKAEVSDEVRFLAAATKEIVDLFGAVSHQDETKWESKALDDFLNILDTRQLKELNNCAERFDDKGGSSHGVRRLKSHFRKLKKYLQKSKYNSDSLEAIRTAVKNHLKRMDIIAKDVKKQLIN